MQERRRARDGRARSDSSTSRGAVDAMLRRRCATAQPTRSATCSHMPIRA